MFSKNLLPHTQSTASILNKEAIGSFETAVPIYKTTCHISEDYNLLFRFLCAS